MTDFDQICFASSRNVKVTAQIFLKTLDSAYIVEKEETARIEINWPTISSINIRDCSALGQKTSETRFGFTANTVISFTPYSHSKYLRPLIQEVMLQKSLHLALEYQWDAGVVFRNGEWVAYKYVRGSLILNSLYNIWTPERLQYIAIPFQLEEISI